MMFACARALRVCALLALPASAVAQTPRSPTIFSPTAQIGTVNVRAAVVLADYSVKPLPLLDVVARRTDRPDSVSVQTDLDGRLSMTLRVGTYTLRAKTRQPIAGKSYAWNVRVVVRPNRADLVQLTNANAVSDSAVAATVVAVAPTKPVVIEPAAAPAPKMVERPAEPVVQKKAVVVAPPPVAAQPSPFTAPPPSVNPEPKPQPARIEQRAPRANTWGLMMGLSFDASSIKSDDLAASTESGAGGAVQLGWGFTKNFALVVDASAARIASLNGDFDLAHVDVGGRWHFVSMRSGFVPFVEVGYSGRGAMKKDALMIDDAGNTYTGDLSLFGSGVSLGGGFNHFVVPKWAIGGAFKWTTGEFSQVRFDNLTVDGFAIDATSARFNMGFTWFPMGR